jgi:hypothetical protein
MASNGRMSEECRIAKDIEGSGSDLIAVLSWDFPRETEENHVNNNQESR